MKIIDQSLISVPDNRQRKEFDEGKHQEMVASLEGKGLMCPLVVRKNIAGGYELVAGERRLRAIREMAEFGSLLRFEGELLKLGELPIVNLGDLPALEARELELEENIRRVDLSWQERVAAEAELMALRTAKAVEEGKPKPTVAELNEETRGNKTAGATARALILARNMHRPEVKGAKNEDDAYKAMKRVERDERNTEMAERLGKEHLSERHRLAQGNCIVWMAAQEAAQFDVICSDPPYGMGADEFGDSGGKTGGSDGEHFYHDSYEAWMPLLTGAVPSMTRLAKPDAHMYLFCDFDRFHDLKGIVMGAGWKVFRTPLIWFKPSAFRAPWPDRGPQRKYECILYAVRGNLKSQILAGDVIQCGPDENLGHPAQKPVALITELLRRSVTPGMKVLDPFCGSGPIFEAAQALSVFATGVEQDAMSCGIAAGRLAKLGATK